MVIGSRVAVMKYEPHLHAGTSPPARHDLLAAAKQRPVCHITPPIYPSRVTPEKAKATITKSPSKPLPFPSHTAGFNVFQICCSSRFSMLSNPIKMERTRSSLRSFSHLGHFTRRIRNPRPRGGYIYPPDINKCSAFHLWF